MLWCAPAQLLFASASAGSSTSPPSVSLRDVLSAEVAAGGPALVEVNMAATEFCDSVGLCALATARAELQEAGRTMTIVAASRPVRRVLELSGMGPLFGALDENPSEDQVGGDDGVIDRARVEVSRAMAVAGRVPGEGWLFVQQRSEQHLPHTARIRRCETGRTSAWIRSR